MQQKLCHGQTVNFQARGTAQRQHAHSGMQHACTVRAYETSVCAVMCLVRMNAYEGLWPCSVQCCQTGSEQVGCIDCCSCGVIALRPASV
jgi:hypothetical protein